MGPDKTGHFRTLLGCGAWEKVWVSDAMVAESIMMLLLLGDPRWMAERSRPGADGLLDALVVGRSTLDGLVCVGRGGSMQGAGSRIYFFVRLVSNRLLACFHEKTFDRG